MRAGLISTPREGTGGEAPDSSDGDLSSSPFPETEEWHLYHIWPTLIFTSSYSASQPLSEIPSLSARDSTGRAFRIRINVLFRVLRIAQQDLLAPVGGGVGGSCGARRRAAEELAVNILLTAYVLMQPYLSEGTPASFQPFRPLVEECADAMGGSVAVAGGEEADEAPALRDRLSKALWSLLRETESISRQPPSKILGLKGSFSFPTQESSEGEDRGAAVSRPSPRIGIEDALALLETASKRTLSLSESRTLSNSLKTFSMNLFDLERVTVTSYTFASIAVHTPRIAIELVEMLLRGSRKSPNTLAWDPASYFQDAANRLPVNDSRSFDLVLKLLSINVNGPVTVSFGVYRHLLPTYLSRCFSAVAQMEAERRSEELPSNSSSGQRELARGVENSDKSVWLSDEQEQELQEETRYHRRTSLSEITCRELDSLLGFLQRTHFLDLLPLPNASSSSQRERGKGDREEDDPSHLHRVSEVLSGSRPSASSSSSSFCGSFIPTREQCQEISETMDAVAVEMKVFALDMVRYRSAGELLRRLM